MIRWPGGWQVGLWVVVEMYEVAGIRELLLEEVIDSSNVLRAYEFGTVWSCSWENGSGGGCSEVSFGAGAEGAGALEVAGLRGVGREAAMLRLLVRGRVRMGGGSGGNVRRGDSFSPGNS